MSPISSQYANQLLAKLTEGCPVPAAPAPLSRYTFQISNHVLIGDTAVAGHKYKGRWRLDDRNIRKAAARRPSSRSRSTSAGGPSPAPVLCRC
ncbi:hypothetical protein [Streptomyces sp. NPDC102476]|uniref:hypothetical protein n=1 Tax=Streptomyces sp. NPDC102476 TaxID=3366181 RepID=UPI00380F75E8